MKGQQVDAVLVQWGERLFYPANRIVKSPPTPRLDTLMRRKAAVIRQRIDATVRRAPQVMVKVTGGGRGESPRVSRRLNTLRGLSHEQVEQVLARGA